MNLMLNSEKIRSLFTIALLVCCGFACKSLGEPHTIKSRDGKFQLTFPAEMAESTTLSDEAEIAAANRPKELYAFVITKRKSEYPEDMTLDQLTEVVRSALVSQLTVTEPPTPQKITVNGNDARRYRLAGTKDGVKIVYVITMVETSGHFHHIYTWTDPARLNENEPILTEISNSFRVNP